MTAIEVLKTERAEDKGEYNEVLWIMKASIDSPVGHHHTEDVFIHGDNLIDMIMELKDYGEENIVKAEIRKFEVT